MERSAQVPELGRTAVDPSLQLGALYFTPPPPGRRVIPLGWDMGQAGASMHLSPTIRQGALGHWVT